MNEDKNAVIDVYAVTQIRDSSNAIQNSFEWVGQFSVVWLEIGETEQQTYKAKDNQTRAKIFTNERSCFELLDQYCAYDGIPWRVVERKDLASSHEFYRVTVEQDLSDNNLNMIAQGGLYSAGNATTDLLGLGGLSSGGQATT